MCVCLGLPFLAAGAEPRPVPGYFERVPDGWISRGGRVEVRLNSRGIYAGDLRLRYEGGKLRRPVAGRTGTLRRYTESTLTESELASQVRYPALYPGIDLILHFDGNALKADYTVAPGADPSRIRFQFVGARRVALDGGDLLIDGMRSAAPVAWQQSDGIRTPVQVGYRVRDGTVSFELGHYNPALPLWIDPYLVGYSRFAGGSLIDDVTALAVDASGNVYLAGSTESSDVVATPLRTYSGNGDAFVVKLDPTQNLVLWATYLGGASSDSATALALHPSGGVAVAGATASSGFPVHSAYQGTRQGGSQDAFLARLDGNGALVFSTFFGGSGADRAYGTAVNASGEIWIVGESDSSDIPRHLQIAGAARGGMEAFAARFTSAGQLASCTTFGGSSTDSARAVATDTSGEVYVTGTTESADFPTVTPFQAASGGAPDAFVAKIAADGTAFRYSSYLGGSARVPVMAETGSAIAVDSSGSAWVTGIASSFAFPLVSPLQSLYGGGNTDAFLARIAPAGTLAYSTYIGGNGSDSGSAVAIAADGTVVVAGSTTSTDLPLLDAMGSPSGTSWDGFVLRISSDGATRQFATYLSGAGSDTVNAAVVRGTSIWVAGSSSSSAFLPSGAPKGLIDGYVAELRPVATVSATFDARSWTVQGTGCEPGTYSGVRTLIWTSGAICAVTLNVETGASTRYLPERWADGPTDNPRTFTAVSGSWSGVYRTEHVLTTVAGSGGTVAPPTGWVTAGSNVTVTATPSTGFAFSGWTGGATGNPATVTVNAPTTLTASFVCAYALSSTSATVGDAATLVAVTVTTGSGCTWTAASNAGWIGVAQVGNEARLSVSANTGTSARTGTVTIAGQTFTVVQSGVSVVAVTFTGPVWQVEGTGCQAGWFAGTQTLSWTPGSQCVVTMHWDVGTGTRGIFDRWNDGSTVNPRTFSATSASWVATYRTEHLLTTAAGPGGTVVPPTGWVTAGSVVTVTATPSTGFAFSGWTGGATGNPASVTVNAPMTLTASFICAYTLSSASASVSDAAALVAVTVTTGSGCSWTATSSAPWIGATQVGSEARLSIAANTGTSARTGTVTIAGQTFTVVQSGVSVVGVTLTGLVWQVEGTGCQPGWYAGAQTLSWTSGAQCTVTMHWEVGTGTRKVFERWNDGSTANPRTFAAAAGAWVATYRTEHLLTTAAGSGGSVAPPTGWVTAGSNITVTATPSTGFAFSGWTGGATGNPATVAANAPMTLTASFACSYALSSASTTVGDAVTLVTVMVTTGSGCAWTATSGASWIGVTQVGNEARLSVAANAATTVRSATVTIAGQTFTVVQSGVQMTAVTFSGPVWQVEGTGCQAGWYAGTQTLSWTPGSQCVVTMHWDLGTGTRGIFERWNDGSTVNPRTFAAASASWVATYRTEHLLTTAAGSGGTVAPPTGWVTAGSAVTVTATPSAGFAFSGWTGGATGNPANVTVNAPMTLTASFACAYSLSSASASVGDAATLVTVTVTTGAGCTWTAASNASWITVAQVGNEARLSVAANTGTSARTGTVTIAGQTFTVVQSGACAYSLSSASTSVGDAATLVTVTVTAGAGCTWTAASNASWITVAQVGSEARLSVAANTGTASRTGTVTIAGQTFTVLQSGACAYSLSSVTASVGDAATLVTVTVTAGSGCTWAATSNASWITVAQVGSEARLSVAANTGTSARTGTVTIAGQTVTVVQSGVPATCTYTLSSTSASVGDAATLVAVTVTTGAGCTWTAASNASWITVAQVGSEARLSVAANTGTTSRTGTVTIAGQTFTVVQSGACAYSLSSASTSVGDAATLVAVTVTTGAGCTWTAASNASWITVAQVGAEARLSVAANTGTTSRTGTVTIAGQTFTVIQSGLQSVAVTLAGRIWDVAGTGCQPGRYTGTQTLTWSIGASCTVTMQPDVGTSTRHTFERWNDGSTTSPRVFTAAAGSWSATYRTEHLLTTAAGPGGTVAPPSAWVAAGASVQVTATPAAGYQFASWTGGLTGNPASVTMNAPLLVTGSFVCAPTTVPGSLSVGSGASQQTLTVTSPCAWTASSSAPWIQVATAGTRVTLTIAANPGAARTGTVSVGGTNVSVTQAAVCNVTAKPPSISAAAVGGNPTIQFTTSPPGCAWTASSTAGWAQVYPLSGTGDGSVGLTVFAHFGLTPRSATLNIGNTVIPVNQAGATGTADERFAGLMYYNFLGRLAAPAEIAFHASTLASGVPRRNLAYNFYNTEEFNLAGRFIAGLYVGLLNRDAEFGGWLFQRGAFVGGFVDQPKLVGNFLSTPEYTLTFGTPTDKQFVALLFRYVLRREATPAEVDFQASALSSLTRVQMAQNFLNSNEFRNGTGPRLTAFLLYSCLLLRDASSAERDALAQQIASGADIRTLIETLIGSTDFDALLR